MLFQLSYLVKFYLFFFTTISIFINLPLTSFRIHWLVWRIMIITLFPTTIFIAMLNIKAYTKLISNSLKNFIIWFTSRRIKINATIILIRITSIPFYSPVVTIPFIPIKPRFVFKNLNMTIFIYQIFF